MIRDSHHYYRGEVYYAHLDPSFGHEQGGTRPVLVLQNDTGNYYSPTLIVTAATSKAFKKPSMPTHVLLTGIEGLPDTSIFMLEVLRTIDKRRIQRYAGRLTKQQMDKIDAALRISLRLGNESCLPIELNTPEAIVEEQLTGQPKAPSSNP